MNSKKKLKLGKKPILTLDTAKFISVKGGQKGIDNGITLPYTNACPIIDNTAGCTNISSCGCTTDDTLLTRLC